MERDYWLSAADAVAYGLADEVIGARIQKITQRS